MVIAVGSIKLILLKLLVCGNFGAVKYIHAICFINHGPRASTSGVITWRRSRNAVRGVAKMAEAISSIFEGIWGEQRGDRSTG